MLALRRILVTGALRVPPITAISPPPPLSSPPPPPPLPLSSPPRRWQHVDDRSVVKVLNLEVEEGLMVDAFSQVGFRLNNGLSIIGSVALFPKTVLSWGVNYAEDINEDTLSLFYMLEPKIDILVLGVGDKGTPVNTNIIRFMKQKGITLEILPTESACTTFNFLNMERRYVAAALLPPASLRNTTDDLLEAQRKNQTLFMDRMEE